MVEYVGFDVSKEATAFCVMGPNRSTRTARFYGKYRCHARTEYLLPAEATVDSGCTT